MVKRHVAAGLTARMIAETQITVLAFARASYDVDLALLRRMGLNSSGAAKVLSANDNHTPGPPSSAADAAASGVLMVGAAAGCSIRRRCPPPDRARRCCLLGRSW
jgi:hypothetical protein